MAPLETLLTRYSHPKLTDPAPGASELSDLFRAAMRAPDHALLRPWRFLTVRGEARIRLGQHMEAAAHEEEADLTDKRAQKLRNAPLRAPLLVVAYAHVQEHPKVPEVEQLLATGAAVENFLVAAHALGYGAMWRTGAIAYNRTLHRLLGLEPCDRIVAFVYVGTPVNDMAAQKAPLDAAPEQYVREWR